MKSKEKSIRDNINRKIDMASPEVWVYIYELIELKQNQIISKFIKKIKRKSWDMMSQREIFDMLNKTSKEITNV
jgi:hypothetical protein